MMKTRFSVAISVFVVMLSGAIQASASAWPAACDKDSIQFKVKTVKNQPAPALEAGKAQIVFFESVSGGFGTSPMSRFGVDGSWAGANKGASYFAVSVTPGEHNICAARQSGAKSDRVNVGEAHLVAQAGEVYYYDFIITRTPIGSPQERGGGGLPGSPAHDMTTKDPETIDTVALIVVDEKEGKHRTNVLPMSMSTVKP
jgi:hypothetical protein